MGSWNSQVRQQHSQLMLARSAQRHLLGNLWVNRAVLNGQVEHRHQRPQTLELGRSVLEHLRGGDHAAFGHQLVDAPGDGLMARPRRQTQRGPLPGRQLTARPR